MSGKQDFIPEFAGGLLPVIAQDESSGEVLMLAWMNELAWQKTLDTGYAHYWSRSRKKIWKKGEESGHTQEIRAIRLDCDSDALLLIVRQAGDAACHTGHRSCFFRELREGKIQECSPPIFDPQTVYKK